MISHSSLDKNLQFRLASVDLLSAAVLAAVVLFVVPGDLSRIYALIVIATSVIPGLMLTGDVKMLNANVGETVCHLRPKVIVCALLNLPVGAASALLAAPASSTLMPIVLLTLVGSLGAMCQSFSSVWYYAQSDKTTVLRSKAASTGVKVAFSGVALAWSELTFALLGITLGAIVEFGLNFRCLPWRSTAAATGRRELISMLGVAYGISRVVSVAIRIGLGQMFGSLIATLLIVEQLVGGINSLFEKYFLRSLSLRRTSQVFKVGYLLVMLAVVPWLVAHPLQPESRTALAWLVLVACAGLLPLAEMYAALQRQGQTFVALGSTIISLLCGTGLALAAWRGEPASGALIAYVALPGMTFLFYLISSIYVRHNPKH